MTASSIIKKLNSRDTRLFPKINTLTKIIFIALIAITTTFFVKNVLAQNFLKDKQDAVEKGNNQESWMNDALGSNLVSIQTMIGGTIPNAVLNGETTPQGYPVSFIPSGMLGHTNQLIASVFNPPASGIQYIAQVKDSFLGKPAYAQGVGFNQLNPILPLWKMFRNITYSIFSLVFIVIGIMIMLRIKISPQAVITVQNSIPKLITALILVTFSYAIAGLCIDLLNFFLAFTLSLLFNGADKNSNLFALSWKDWSISNLINAIKGHFGINAFDFKHLNATGFFTMFSMLNRMAPSIAIAALGGVLGTVIGAFVGSIGGAALGFFIGALGLLIVIEIILIISIFKFLFGLMKCYLTIILRIIFAPLEIALGAFPSSKMGFSNWLKEIVGNMAVFPISILFLVLINIIIDLPSQGLWAPTILSGVGPFFLPTIIGIAGILMLSKLPTLIPEAIFMIKPSPFGKAIGEGLTNNAIVKTGGLFGKELMSSGASQISTRLSDKIKNSSKESSAGRAADIPK